MRLPVPSKEARGLIVALGNDKGGLRESIAQLLRKNAYDGVFRAEMVAVDQIDPQRARLQEDAVFHVCRDVGIAACLPRADEIGAARTSEHGDMLRGPSGVIVAKPSRFQLLLA